MELIVAYEDTVWTIVETGPRNRSLEDNKIAVQYYTAAERERLVH
jgi:hypothetical protein